MFPGSTQRPCDGDHGAFVMHVQKLLDSVFTPAVAQFDAVIVVGECCISYSSSIPPAGDARYQQMLDDNILLFGIPRCRFTAIFRRAVIVTMSLSRTVSTILSVK